MSKQGFFSEHWTDANGNPNGGTASGRGFTISWQNGPLGRDTERKEPNGAFVEDVLAAVIDRITFYQNGRFACPENAQALEDLKCAALALDLRTQRREAANIEGTHAEDVGEPSKARTYAEATKYPELYADTYWGNFNNDTDRCAAAVIEARNQFAYEFDLVRQLNQYPLGDDHGLPHVFDHAEVYATRQGRVLVVFSPYEKDVSLLEEAGLTRYGPSIYSTRTSTYFGLFDNMQEYQEWAVGLDAR